MKNYLSSIIVISFLIVSTSACTNREVGTTGGAVAGGVIGSAVTHGSTAGTIAGAVGGGFIGNQLSR